MLMPIMPLRAAQTGILSRSGEFGVFMVEHVFRGYDAFEKGIQDGDTVVEVDGRPTVLSTQEEIQRRRGHQQHPVTA